MLPPSETFETIRLELVERLFDIAPRLAQAVPRRRLARELVSVAGWAQAFDTYESGSDVGELLRSWATLRRRLVWRAVKWLPDPLRPRPMRAIFRYD